MQYKTLYQELVNSTEMIRALIKDNTAFRESLQRILAHEFDRTIVGHGKNIGERSELERIVREG